MLGDELRVGAFLNWEDQLYVVESIDKDKVSLKYSDFVYKLVDGVKVSTSMEVKHRETTIKELCTTDASFECGVPVRWAYNYKVDFTNTVEDYFNKRGLHVGYEKDLKCFSFYRFHSNRPLEIYYRLSELDLKSSVSLDAVLESTYEYVKKYY